VEEPETSADAEIVLYGVVGLQRGRGGRQGDLRFVRPERQARVVWMSERLTFVGPEGGLITITSHRPGDDDQFQRIRAGAPMNPYLASPRGQVALAARGKDSPVPRPVEVDWTPTTILVDGQDTPFEMCDLGDGYWAAAGRIPAAIVTIDSRKVPISTVSLERLASREPPPPLAPDLGDRTKTVIQALDDRFARLPFGRVHRSADHWALRDVEIDHVNRLAHREGLSNEQLEALEAYWLERIEAPLRMTMDRHRFKNIEAMHRSRIARHLGRGFLFQLWFNTVGPGARTWFGNRYVGIRHYTFRLRWRP
jgi:hypothetical protein